MRLDRASKPRWPAGAAALGALSGAPGRVGGEGPWKCAESRRRPRKNGCRPRGNIGYHSRQNTSRTRVRVMNKSEWPESVNGASVPYGRPLAELSKLASGPPPARWPAFYAIGRIDTDAAFAILSTFADDRDADVRRTATEVLGRLTDRPEIDSLLCRALRDSAGAVVRTACDIAGERRRDAARPTLREVCCRTELHTRVAAVRALAQLGHPEDIDVAEALMMTTDATARKEAAFACRSLASSESWRRLASVWLSDPVPRHRMWASELIEEFGGVGDRRALDHLCADADGHVREAARRAVMVLDKRAG